MSPVTLLQWTNQVDKPNQLSEQSKSEAAWKGDDLSNGKDNKAIRMMFHNLNGLTPTGPNGIDVLVNDQADLQVDILGLTEHCLDTTKFQVVQSTQTSLRKAHQGPTVLQLNSSSESAINRYKPGGTGILMIGDTVGRLEPQGKGGDKLGRWSYVHLRRKHHLPVTVITAYQVCPRPTNLLGNTAYHQQRRALNMDGRNNVHPRQAFIQDLSKYIVQLRHQGHEIILGGDFNEALEDRNSGIMKLITATNMTDPFLTKFPQHPPFGTHLAGKKRIDYVFITPGLAQGVLNVGYAPYEYTKASDHRAIFLEIDKGFLFGQQFQPQPTTDQRILQSKDRKAVSQFIHKWYEEILRQNGFSFTTQLNTDQATPNVVEMIDSIIGQSGDTAEQSCRRRRPTFYSNLLVQQRLTVAILRGHLNSMLRLRDRTNQLQSRMRRAGLDFPLPITPSLTKVALQNAREKLRQTSQKSVDTRHAELESMVNEAALRGHKSKERILKSIKRVEANQKTFRTLRNMRKTNSNAPKIDRVEIPKSWPEYDHNLISTTDLEDPKTCTEWRWVTDPKEIEFYLMLRNRIHFSQAEGTPFTCSPMREELDWAASTETATNILEGQYQFTSTMPPCGDLLQACKACSNLDALPAEITIREFGAKIKRWRESTTTSPSGRHLGRYKALFATGISESEELQEGELSLQAKQEAISALILAVINYCLRNKYTLERWKKIVNVMIFKEPSNFKIHRLRIIHIYEADFNLILAVKWRELLRHAIDQNLLNEGQYGGKPGCEAQSLTLLEELKYDISHLTRRTLFNFDNDATSCYDRIVVSLASLINRKYGLHANVAAVHAKTLQEAKFHLKTAAGVSERFYSPSSRFPIHGTGQGSGNSPCIWLFLSSTLFDIHLTQSHGAQFFSPDGTVSARFSMVGFVDDATGTCNDFRPGEESKIDDIVLMMQQDAQLWSDLLYCSGGKLELPKCSFHVLSFQFQPNGRPIPTIESFDNRIGITDSASHEHVQIPFKKPFDPHLTLGHYKSPTSTGKTALIQLQNKAERVTTLICISPIDRHGANLAYQTIYIPTIRFTLPQSFFTRKDLDRAQMATVSKIISKCGYNRNTARALIFAPTSYAGGGFLPWYLIQGEGQVKNFIKHWRTNTIVSKMLRITVSWAQWQSGLNQSILEDTISPISYLECRWLSSLREFLKTINGRILLDTPGIPHAERRNDIHIMRVAIDCGLFNDQDLKILNYCRLYLHVATVSELFNVAGTEMLPEMYDCKREPWFDPTSYVTLQKRPSDYQVRKKWQKLCRLWINDQGHASESTRLGEWTSSGGSLRRRRQTYMIVHRPFRVYHWIENCYWKYQPVEGNPRVFQKTLPTDWTPNHQCVPIDASLRTDGFLIVNTRIPTQPEKQPDPRLEITFGQSLRESPSWETELFSNVVLHKGPEIATQALLLLPEDERQLIMVSDGSVRGTSSTYGWVFGTTKKDRYAENFGLGNGETTSHRAEAWGMLSGVVFVSRYVAAMQSKQSTSLKPSVTFYSDNKGLVERVSNRLKYNENYPNATLKPDWDLVEQITATIRQIGLHMVSIQWVKGHQEGDPNDLPSEVAFNIAADQLAATAHMLERSHTAPALLPSENCRLFINHSSINGGYSLAIREAFTLPGFFLYMQQRHGWSSEMCQSVDWKTFNKAVCKNQASVVQLLKLVHDKLPTNSELAKSDPYQSPVCHYCSEKETFYHILLCQNDTSRQFRTTAYEAVKHYLEYKGTHSDLKAGLLYIVSASLALDPECDLEDMDSLIVDCINQQIKLGLPLFLRGFISLQWTVALETQSSESGQTSSTSDLLPGVISLLWKHQFTLWERHTTQLNNNTAPDKYHDRLLKFKERIQVLHTKQFDVIEGHRHQYFFDDVDEFLQTATKAQMAQYLHQYEPAIYSSIATAKSRTSRSLLTFPGFERRVQPRNLRSISRISRSVVAQHDGSYSPQIIPPPNPFPRRINTATNRGTPPNRRHTRWKTSLPGLNSIHKFFQNRLPNKSP